MSNSINQEITPHKIFISYCWTNKEHEEWVHALAERLVSNGVDVKYDKWDLKKGQDKYSFMESMVQDENIEKVLIICEHGYKEKSDKREGGVGTEVQIITPELYGKVNQTKFVPIIAEVGEEFESYIPTFLKSRIGIDMSSIEKYEEGYEDLLRLIYDKPKFTKPKLGVMPSFLDEKPFLSYKIQHTINNIKNGILKKSEIIDYYIQDFIPQFIETLNDYQIEFSEIKEQGDEIVYNKIADMLPLRNRYIEFLETICKLKRMNIDNIISLFEQMYKYTDSREYGQFNEYQFDQYKFFIVEILLYTISILIKYNSYEEIFILVNTPYFVQTIHDNSEKPYSIKIFNNHIKSLEYRNQRLSLNKICYAAQLLIDRGVFNNKDYSQDIVNADLLIHYLTSIKLGTLINSWFPILYIYKNEKDKLDIFRKLISNRHFEKIKKLFGVKTIEELQNKISRINEEYAQYMCYSNFWKRIPSIKLQIVPEEIGSML